MIESKHIKTVTAILVCACLLACGFIVYAANTFDTTKVTEYQKRLFGDEIITLEIQADKDDWQGLLDNARAKEWISADLVINGERFNSVGVRTKGNSSLSMGSRQTGGESDNLSARYSLQFKFNKYVKGQTYYGLDAFCINNMMGDATYMKDYMSYEIMNYIGVDTPLTNYADVKVNGEDYGFCVALERYDEAFLNRVYNTSAGELYSVKISMGQRGDFEDRWNDVENAGPNAGRGNRNNAGQQQPDGGARPDFSGGGVPEFPQAGGEATGGSFAAPNFPQDGGEATGGGFAAPIFPQDGGEVTGGEATGGEATGGGAMGRGFGGMGGMGGNGGGSLIYTDDDPASYSAIFDNPVFGVTSDKEAQRVITAIKNLNAGTDLEKYFDVDAILRYFAAHTVVVNLDSYISNMQQNYYIYERDGKITVLPWDYGLAWGGFQSGNASGVVNFPIDTPVSGVSMEDRPLLNKLLEDDEYRERYHGYLRQIVEGYFESGLFEDTINGLDAKIGEYVKNDVSAYFTYEQYRASLPEFIKLGLLRAESIRGQLDGTVPSDSAGQNADSSSLIDASDLNLSALGSMMGGGGGMGGNRQDGQGENPQEGNTGIPGGGMFGMDRGLMQQAFQIISDGGGGLTDELREALLEIGITEEQIETLINMQGGFAGGNMRQGGAQDRGGQDAFPGGNQGNQPNGGNFPGGNMPGGDGTGGLVGTAAQSGTGMGYIVTAAALLILLAAAIIFVARPRKTVI